MINLKTKLALKNSFMFPMQSKLAQKEVLVVLLWLLVPLLGWILNMGHRIQFAHQM